MPKKRNRFIVHQQCHPVARHKVNWKLGQLPPTDVDKTPWSPVLTEEQQDIVDELNGFNYSKIMTKTEAQILKLNVMEGKKPKEIAEIFNLKTREVGRILQQVGRKLKAHLKLEDK